MKNVVYWDVMPHFSNKNRRFGGTLHLHITRIGELGTT
jgi:hypothetical protein